MSNEDNEDNVVPIDRTKMLAEFTEAARPLMKWMAENLHPHHEATVCSISAELNEGVCSTGPIYDYIKD